MCGSLYSFESHDIKGHGFGSLKVQLKTSELFLGGRQGLVGTKTFVVTDHILPVGPLAAGWRGGLELRCVSIATAP